MNALNQKQLGIPCNKINYFWRINPEMIQVSFFSEFHKTKIIVQRYSLKFLKRNSLKHFILNKNSTEVQPVIFPFA